VVTIVFTDVAGSTALGERLDPESLRRVMWRYFDTMQATLGDTADCREVHRRRHCGRVRCARCSRDDALRAVRAAFEMSEALERVNEELAREHGVRIAARTGINTGEVIVGDTATDSEARDRRRGQRRGTARAGRAAGRGAPRRSDVPPRRGCRRRRGGARC